MFTVNQIKTAHSKVKSGADFPAYIAELKQLGVQSYVTYVSDGHTDFYGKDGYKTTSPAKYDTLVIAPNSDIRIFAAQLKAHQKGESDYPTFCKQAADSGTEKWVVDLTAMTCTYFDKAGNMMLEEIIPGSPR